MYLSLISVFLCFQAFVQFSPFLSSNVTFSFYVDNCIFTISQLSSVSKLSIVFYVCFFEFLLTLSSLYVFLSFFMPLGFSHSFFVPSSKGITICSLIYILIFINLRYSLYSYQLLLLFYVDNFIFSTSQHSSLSSMFPCLTLFLFLFFLSCL